MKEGWSVYGPCHPLGIPGHEDEVLGSRLQPRPTPTVSAIWRVNQQMEEFFLHCFLYIILSNKHMLKKIMELLSQRLKSSKIKKCLGPECGLCSQYPLWGPVLTQLPGNGSEKRGSWSKYLDTCCPHGSPGRSSWPPCPSGERINAWKIL